MYVNLPGDVIWRWNDVAWLKSMAEPWAPATLPCSRNRFYNARAGAVGLFASKSEQSRCTRTRWAHSHACDARTVALRLNVIILLQHHPIVCGSWTGIVVIIIATIMGFDVQKYTVRRMQTNTGAICDVFVSVDVFAQRYIIWPENKWRHVLTM